MPSIPAIQIESLTFMYAGTEVPVLRDVSWEVPEGAFALLVGGTGSGKSTLLSLLKPEISPSGSREGALRVLGKPASRLKPEESARGVGYVFQNPDNQLVCESVWHEMAFGLENLGTPQDEMRRLVAETSYFFGMEDWFRCGVDALSGGRKQLLALASTLVMQPRLLLLDEPTAQLDPIAEKNFLHALFRVNRELGCTVVVATHQPRAMVDYATCAVELREGTLHPVADMEGLRACEPLFEGRDASVPVSSFGRQGISLPLSEQRGRSESDGRAQATGCPEGGALEPRRGLDGTQSNGLAAASRSSAPPKPRLGSAESRPAVELKRAWFRYGRDERWVLRNLDLRVSTGRIHALVGGNGCGKSTLLSLMAGSQRLQKGRLSCAARSHALLPQDPRALFAEETAFAELMEWASMARYGQRRVEDMLDILGLSACSSVHPYDLSGGQQQLLALGKLLLLDPELLLLDEPTKGLDAPARRAIAELLLKVVTEGATIVLAAHDLDFVNQMADEVSMVFDGEIACTSPREEFFKGNVYYRP